MLTKYKFAYYKKIAREALVDIKVREGLDGDDFARDLVTQVVEGFIYADQVQEKIIPCYLPKPSFLDWFLSRERKIDVVFKAKDIVLNPPKTDKTVRHYSYDIK